MPVKHLKKITDFTAKMPPHHVHLACQGTVTVTIVASCLMHMVSPIAEAVGLGVAGLFAAWQRDIELRMIRNLRRIAHQDEHEELEEA